MNDPRILGPIPTPPAQRWKEFRLLYLPRAMFLVGVVAAAWLWSNWVAPATLVAEADFTHVEVRAPQAGMLVGLKIEVLQTVKAGDVIGQVASANPRVLDATLAVIKADIGMLNASLAGLTDAQRVTIALERMQLDWMNHRVELASLRGRLQQAEADLTRGTPLHAAAMITEEAYEQMKITRDSLTAQVEEQSKLVAYLEPLVKTLATPEAQAAALSPDAALASGIKLQEAKLQLAEAQLNPLPLVAPMSGIIALQLRRTGETVVAGEPVLRISATKPERLVGFLQQPIPFEPKVGMSAEIRTRTLHRHIAATKILQVGPAMEPILPTLIAAMRLPTSPAPESGLRVEFALPQGLTLVPGEHVDVVIH